MSEHDGPYIVIIDHEETGTLYFGPFRTYATAEKAVARIERIARDADWSIEALQPGSYSPEWARIIAES